MTVGQSESGHQGQELHKLSKRSSHHENFVNVPSFPCHPKPSPKCSVVTGHKNGDHRLDHSKGVRRDGLEYRGNVLPVTERVGKSIPGKIAPPSRTTADDPVGCATIDDTVDDKPYRVLWREK